MGVYEENIVPVKISRLAEYVSRRKKISLDDALVYIYANPMYRELYDEGAKWWYLSTEALYENFVVGCRREDTVKHDFDLVFGPVANDNVFTTVNLYESGILDAPAAIAQLKAYKTYDQLSFHTQRVVSELRFVGSYEVNESK